MKSLSVAVALLHREGRWLLQRRALDAEHLAGLWEFPGGKVEAGETPEQALERELLEELSWSPGELKALAPISHVYPDRKVILLPFWMEGPPLPRTALAWGWFTPTEVARLSIPEANRPLISLLESLP